MKHPNRRGRALAALLASALAAIAGCQTTPEDAGEEAAVRAGDQIEFTPRSAMARLQLEEGRYPTLFGPGSYCLWVGPEINAQRRAQTEQAGEAIAPESDRAAQLASEHLLVLECRVESAFADMSIAYDVVGFRGVNVYLLTPQGKKIPPAQVIVGEQLEEERQGALRKFGRTNLLLFPRNQIDLTVPGGAASASTARMVLEGQDSTFYFEWYPQLPEEIGKAPLFQREGFKNFKMGYNEFFRKLNAFTHNFD